MSRKSEPAFRTLLVSGEPVTAWIERHPDGRRALYFKDLAGHRFFQQLPDQSESETIDDFSFDTLAYRYSALLQATPPPAE